MEASLVYLQSKHIIEDVLADCLQHASTTRMPQSELYRSLVACVSGLPALFPHTAGL